MGILYFLIIGLIAGFLAGKVMRGTGYGLVGDLIVGCIGALLGGWLLGLLGVHWGGFIGSDWHPELKRGADQDIRTWGQMGLTGDWAGKHITPHGYALRYASALEFSSKVLQVDWALAPPRRISSM